MPCLFCIPHSHSHNITVNQAPDQLDSGDRSVTMAVVTSDHPPLLRDSEYSGSTLSAALWPQQQQSRGKLTLRPGGGHHISHTPCHPAEVNIRCGDPGADI